MYKICTWSVHQLQNQAAEAKKCTWLDQHIYTKQESMNILNIEWFLDRETESVTFKHQVWVCGSEGERERERVWHLGWEGELIWLQMNLDLIYSIFVETWTHSMKRKHMVMLGQTYITVTQMDRSITIICNRNHTKKQSNHCGEREKREGGGGE